MLETIFGMLFSNGNFQVRPGDGTYVPCPPKEFLDQPHPGFLQRAERTGGKPATPWFSRTANYTTSFKMIGGD